MKPEDKKEIMNLFNQGFEEVVIPYLARMQEDIAQIKEDITEIHEKLDDHTFRLDRVERKLNAVVDRQDEQGLEIKKLKDKLA